MFHCVWPALKSTIHISSLQTGEEISPGSKYSHKNNRQIICFCFILLTWVTCCHWAKIHEIVQNFFLNICLWIKQICSETLCLVRTPHTYGHVMIWWKCVLHTRGIRISDAAFLKREVGEDILPSECLFHILITLFTLRIHIFSYAHFREKRHSLIFSQRRNENCLENFLELCLP